MLAWRTTWHIKPGHLPDALAMVRQLHDSFGPLRAHENATARLYFLHSGPADTLMVEDVWPTVEAHDRWWAGFNKTAAYAAFTKAWSQIVDSDTPEEVWEVIEWAW